MLSIAVCDDEVIECCYMAKRMKEIMEEMKIPCIIRQFRSHYAGFGWDENSTDSPGKGIQLKEHHWIRRIKKALRLMTD